ncbi:hypothetical protein K437DRAFT_256254 [Tilletiaria anomala UBC 951]|uniref:Uncharacterized protein n=1 Tax=Tilletiaria anomala (strain ATCC 24038 / CBS 436.72 / UBC 951) TaxID=1037660 RepID=A0A066W5E9_TILAU|nr:uncharacterized protein K437DRAFT_256254 [Tilletiaria anomala UBC 951]KDN46294.1 hypothetical protein K437DRAFT_256254 [Tilletiaria anomala UBC 951]
MILCSQVFLALLVVLPLIPLHIAILNATQKTMTGSKTEGPRPLHQQQLAAPAPCCYQDFRRSSIAN